MGQPNTLGIVAALAVAGTGLGLYLGESAVDQIDPVHYGSYGGTRFFADLVPNPPDRDSPPAPTYANGPLPTDYGNGCIGCRRASDNYFLDYEVPAYEVDYASVDLDAPTPDEIVADVEAEIAAAAARAARAEVLRYAHFQVAAGEEEERAAPEPKPVRSARSENGCRVGDGCVDAAAPGI